MTAFRISKRAMLMAACASAAIATPAFAQEAPGTSAQEEEVVIVNATRRATALQATPVAVTAVSAAQLQDAGVRDIRDLTQLAPSLQVPVSESSASVTARIRGIGTQGSNPGLESSVGVFVDGVYRARNGVAFGDLGELQAVEVLRGPQGTLFGRNTSAGLINVTTKRPQFEFGTSGDVTFGNYGAFGIGAGITGPLSDDLAGRVYIAARSRDGYVNINPGAADRNESHNQAYISFRGQLLWQPREEVSVLFIGDVSSRKEACCAAVVFRPDSRPVSTTAILNRIVPDALATRSGMESFESRANRSYDQSIEDRGLSVEVDWDLGFGTLTSVTAWRNWKWVYGQDADFNRADVLYRDIGEKAGNEFTTITQEFRLAGTAGKLDWLVGAFYSDETIDRIERFRIGSDYQAYIGGLLAGANALVLPVRGGPVSLETVPLGFLATGAFGIAPGNIAGFTAGGGTKDEFNQQSTSIALFTHNIYNFTDNFSVTLGLRYTAEDKDFRADYSTTGNGACRALESRFGLNPTAGIAPFGAGAIGAAGALCAPWMRSALDNIDHRQAKEEREWSGIVSGSYRVTDDINTYASYSRGYKAGGFNLDRAFSDTTGGVPTSVVIGTTVGAQTVRNPDTSFAPETVDAFEIGIKTQWLDRQITANFALFHQTFENFQLNTFNGISFVVTAVPEVVAQGVEMDFVVRPDAFDGLTITGGAAYSDTQYTNNLGSVADPRTFLGQNPNLYFIQDRQLTSSPEWTFGGAVNYETAVNERGTLLKTYLDFRYVSEYNTGSNLDPRKEQNEYTLVNARVALSTADERWSIELWGRNLTDQRYAQITFDAPLQGDSPQLVSNGAGGFVPRPITSQLGAFVGEPQMYGITIRWNH